jgi:hypothetical protein
MLSADSLFYSYSFGIAQIITKGLLSDVSPKGTTTFGLFRFAQQGKGNGSRVPARDDIARFSP